MTSYEFVIHNSFQKMFNFRVDVVYNTLPHKNEVFALE